MAVYNEHDFSQPWSARAGSLVNYAGAALSLALIIGVSVWGYKLIMRDVTGIPVVRAMEGDMRVAPQDPGGDVALNEGLAVNEVAALGEAAGPEDTLLLAPPTAGLSQEDLTVQPLAEAGEVLAVDPVGEDAQTPASLEADVPAPTGPLNADDVLALADQIAGAAAPLSALAEGQDVAPEVLLDGLAVDAGQAIDAAIPGVRVSLRPAVRPASLQVPVAAVVAAPEVAAPEVADVDQAVAAAIQTAAAAIAPALTPEAVAATAVVVPTGANLVQLGAFPSVEQASEEWVRLSGRFADFLGPKEKVIQEATSGGQVFYRLRAMGFDDLGDARRFCAALVAGNADCIPVVAR